MPPLTGLTVVAPGGAPLLGPSPACVEGKGLGVALPSPPSPRTLRTANALADIIGVLWAQVLTVFSSREEVEEGEEAEAAVEEGPAPGDGLAPVALAPTSASLAAAYRCHALPLPPPTNEGRLTVRGNEAGIGGGGGAARRAEGRKKSEPTKKRWASASLPFFSPEPPSPSPRKRDRPPL